MIPRRKPLKRSWIRPKKRVRKESWRSGRIREDSAGMARLRSEAYERSQGKCECVLADPKRICERRATWIDGHMHHIVHRSQGGSDVLENVAFINRLCHAEIHGEPQWSKR